MAILLRVTIVHILETIRRAVSQLCSKGIYLIRNVILWMLPFAQMAVLVLAIQISSVIFLVWHYAEMSTKIILLSLRRPSSLLLHCATLIGYMLVLLREKFGNVPTSRTLV